MLLKEQKKIQDAPESNQQEEKKAKKRKDPSTVPSTLPKSQTNTYRLYRSDNFGNINEVTIEEIEEILAHHPKLSEMIKNPNSIDIS